MHIGAILVHGIGAQGPQWADGIVQALEGQVLAEVARLLPGKAPNDSREILVTGRVHWAGLLQVRQIELERILNAQRPLKLDGPWWRRALTTVVHSLRKTESRFVTECIGDVIGYPEPEVRTAIYATIVQALEQMTDRIGVPGVKAPVTLIAHSLGSVISSDYVWDAAKARAATGHRGFHDRLQLANFFTVGSPLALFSLRYGGPEAFDQPIAVEHPEGRWVNLFDNDDPVGMPLKPLNAAYRRVVLKDVQVESGPYLFSHGGYFTKSETLTIISRKLALDWVALNRKLPDSTIDTLYERYDRTLDLNS